MSDWVELVRQFHLKFGAPVAERPGLIPEARASLRMGLIAEEESEVAIALYDPVEPPEAHIAEVADGLADLIYVCIGAALEYGIDLDSVFREVHRSNMTKTKGVEREDGKILKGPTFEPPRIREIIEEAMKR